MAVVLSSNFVAAPSGVKYVTANSPRVLYDDVIEGANAAADEEATDHPVTLLQHYLTGPGERWKGTSTAVQYVEFNLDGAKDIDAVGIAAHNLGSTGGAVQVQASDDGVNWTDASQQISPADNETIFFLFAEINTGNLRLKLTPNTDTPQIGVVFAGKSLGIQHRIYQGHAPVTLGRQAKRFGQISDTGQFLGMVVTSEWYETGAKFENLQPDWYRTYFKPFARAALQQPFFWAWRPESYPKEVGFAWLTSPVTPENSGPAAFMSVSMDMRVFVG